MSTMEEKTKMIVDELHQGVKDIAINVRFFSFSLRVLYAEEAVGTDEEVAKEFRDLRDDTRNDAMVYIEGILPLVTKLVTSISEYFDYYDALTFDEWFEYIPMIRKETAGHKKLCETLLKLHHDTLVPLKKRKDQADILVGKIENHSAEFEKKKTALKNEANAKRSWATALFFIPVVGAIASPILNASGEKDLAEATAAGERAQIQKAAALIVEKTLIPAFQAFIDGISKAVGFFSVMEHELQKFENNAKKSEDDPKFIFFKVLKMEAKDIKSICQVFYAALPDAKTDFEAMPTKGTDRNYVDEWLEKQKKAIREECKGKLAENMLPTIAHAV